MSENGEAGISKPTELEKKIIKQIEYYFGDKNLQRDKFLQGKIHEGDGWVPMECLVTFNRLKALSTDFEVIFNALKKSSSGLLELDSDKSKVKRSENKPVPAHIDPEEQKLSKQKTVYAKGFPVDYTIDQVEQFLEDKGEVVFIKLRRDDNKAFKGSVFIEFTTPAIAQEFINMKDLKIGDTVLEKMTRDDYYKKKDEEKKTQKTGSEKQKEEKEERNDYKLGCVLHFKGAGDETSREDLKEIFGKHGEIDWVDFTRNDTEGKIRFKEEGSAQKVIDSLKEANDGKIIINGVEAVVRVLEGDEEAEYWKQAAKEKAQLRQKRGGRGRKNTQRGQKRPWQNRREEKTEEVKKPVAGQGEHKRFDDEERKKNNDEKKEEPESKQAKVE